MKPLSDKTAGFTDSVIRRMTRVSNQYGAVNLSQGFPDFDPPKEITDRLREIAPHGPHQYALTWGAQNFREALARKHEHFSGMKVDPNKEIVVTCGSTEAMMASMLTVCNPGDKVVVFSPFYENYGADAILSGAQPIYVPLNPPEFNFDANVLEDAMKQDGVKALILCNPSNPCGKVFTLEELQIIADLAINTICMLLLMKCMSIFCISRINIFIWPRCLECVSVQLSATPFQRLIPLQDGVWVMSLHRLKSLTESRKCTTS